MSADIISMLDYLYMSYGMFLMSTGFTFYTAHLAKANGIP